MRPSSNITKHAQLAIIIPVYNTGRYVNELLQDLIQQTFRDFLAFLINDGSQDNSLQLLEQVALADTRFRVINKSNGGPGSTRNAGLELISRENLKFDYIWFCDSDDRIEPHAIEKVISALTRTQTDYGLMSIRRFDKSSEKTVPAHILSETLLDHDDIVRQYFRYGWKWRKEPCSDAFLNNKLFRFELIQSLRFREDIMRAEDFDFFIRLLPKLRSGVLVPDAFFRYRLRKSSLTKSFSDTGDLAVCSSHYSTLKDRTKVEQIAIQHRLIRAYYLDVCQAFSNNDIARAEMLLKNFTAQKFEYPFLFSDLKILALMGPFRAFLPRYIRSRNQSKKSGRLENFYE